MPRSQIILSRQRSRIKVCVCVGGGDSATTAHHSYDSQTEALPGRAARSRAELALREGDDGHRTRGHTKKTHD